MGERRNVRYRIEVTESWDEDVLRQHWQKQMDTFQEGHKMYDYAPVVGTESNSRVIFEAEAEKRPSITALASLIEDKPA